MSFEKILNDAFSYAKEGIWEKWGRWFLLIVSLIIFPLILGYMVRIYRGETPAPEPKEWWAMFVDGIKLLVVCLIYALPIILLVIAAFLPVVSAFVTSGGVATDFTTMSDAQAEQWITAHPEILSAFGLMAALLLVTLLVAIVISIFSFIGSVRFARTGKIGEGFNFSEILAQIRRIGWFTYIAALIIMAVIGLVFWIVLRLFTLIPVAGGYIYILILLVFYPPFLLFSGRYAAKVYELGEPAQAGTPAQQN